MTHKFIVFTCGRGDVERDARHNSLARGYDLLFKLQLDKAKSFDADPDLGEHYVAEQTDEHCIPVANTSPSEADNQPSVPVLPQDNEDQEHPSSVRFRFRNQDHYALSVKFFAPDDHTIWPGPQNHYSLTGEQSYNLSCHPGEKICYGVYRDNQNVSWGLGRNGLDSCSDCCLTCGGETTVNFVDAGPDAGPPPATFYIHDADRYSLGIRFFSETNHRWWPGNGRYELAGSQIYRLACTVGEKICFGAWRDNQRVNWGVGPNNTYGCQHCCTVCGGTFTTTIRDGGPDNFLPPPSSRSSDDDSSAGSHVESSPDDTTSLSDILDAATAIIGAIPLTGGSAPTYRPAPRGPSSTITGLDHR